MLGLFLVWECVLFGGYGILGCVAGCILPLLCSLAVRGGCFVAIVVVLIVAVPLCRLAFFLIIVMLNLFQHLVVYNIQVSAFEAALLFSLRKSKQKAMAQVRQSSPLSCALRRYDF